MARAVVVVILVGGFACSSSQHVPLATAGDKKDDGAGELAQASLHLTTPADTDPRGFTDQRGRPADFGYGGDAYGGVGYGGFGGDPYGGSSYANWRIPQWSYAAPNRMPRYNVSLGLTGAIEGAVTWHGQPPAKVSSACGPIDNPTLRVGSDKGVRGVIVYIEKISIGRNTPYYSKPASVGGMVAKRGCTLVPAAQIVTPLPGSVSVHGDSQRTKLRAAGKTHELQEGGIVQLEIKSGITKIDGEDGRLAAAWVLGLETPYYAITDDAGRFRLDELAAGTYELTFWQPPIATASRDGTWTYGSPIVVKRTVKVDAKTPARVSITLPVR